MLQTNYSFLTLGKTQESTEAGEFKRYIGVGSSKIIAVNPNKAELDKVLGFESQNAPEYTGTDDGVKWARVTFVVETVPESNNGIDIKTRISFTLRDTPAYNRDQTKVQVIDDYGNSTWASREDAESHKKLLSASGNPLKVSEKYHIAYSGEAELVDFLRKYLNMKEAFSYVNNAWELKSNADESLIILDSIKDYFNGDFSEIKSAIAREPNNVVKLLYGVRNTDDGKQYQTVATRLGFVLKHSAGAKAYERLERELENAKQNGSYATTDFKVQELQEWSATPTNLDKAPEENNDMPWD